MASAIEKRVSSSFRDPSGFVFRDQENVLLRQVNKVYEPDYRCLMDSGLYDDLVENRLLIRHEEVDLQRRLDDKAIAVIRPDEVDFISYPYEWSFSALKHAALLTLEMHRRAIGFDMSLKDASAYNVQFHAGRPVFIDTLSFERYREGEPWIAYGQFCQHFLAPLALMAKTDVELGRLLTIYLDGIPLQLASRLLPRRSWFNLGLVLHLHLHAWMINRHSKTSWDDQAETKSGGMSRSRVLSLIEGLKRTVRKLKWAPRGTEWADYYETSSYTPDSADQKQRVVSSYLRSCSPKLVWDLGANTGVYSRLAADLGGTTVAFDIDPACIEKNYLWGKKNKESHMLPLRQDLTNPSPALGWAHAERDSLADRGDVDVVMALALVHHLAIGNNLPLEMIAEYLAKLGRHLIVEFVPKEDRQVQRLLASREDVFSSYTKTAFEAAFRDRFAILESQDIGNDGRIVYLMRRVNENGKTV